MEKDLVIIDLIKMICEIKDVNIDPKQEFTELVLYSEIRNSVRGVFNSKNILSNYNLI